MYVNQNRPIIPSRETLIKYMIDIDNLTLECSLNFFENTKHNTSASPDLFEKYWKVLCKQHNTYG